MNENWKTEKKWTRSELLEELAKLLGQKEERKEQLKELDSIRKSLDLSIRTLVHVLLTSSYEDTRT